MRLFDRLEPIYISDGDTKLTSYVRYDHQLNRWDSKSRPYRYNLQKGDFFFFFASKFASICNKTKGLRDKGKSDHRIFEHYLYRSENQVMISGLIQVWFSLHNGNDHYYLHLLIRSSNIWYSFIPIR